ncbi:hypothetical protein ACFOSV_13525 [Algoriphagus namhaensis]|uniref:Uncharacterized protein n=1 Tax=Algoriphagus namhaensis TaxID=915353 RepID=A0ABV8ATD2_9BACT
MAKVIITAKVEDSKKWEEGFRTHGELFKRQTCASPVHISINEGNEVALIFEPSNVETFFKILDTEGPAAMSNDGVIRETVKIFVMDNEFHL